LKRGGANKKEREDAFDDYHKAVCHFGCPVDVTPAFAARAIHPDTHDICREQNAGFCQPSPFDVEIPGAISKGQAKANAASKTWPGDMILD
jgi:hypothetical protein